MQCVLALPVRNPLTEEMKPVVKLVEATVEPPATTEHAAQKLQVARHLKSVNPSKLSNADDPMFTFSPAIPSIAAQPIRTAPLAVDLRHAPACACE